MAEWVATRSILDICLQTEELAGGGRPQKRWSDQVVPLQREDEEWQAGKGGHQDGDGSGATDSKEIDEETRRGYGVDQMALWRELQASSLPAEGWNTTNS